MGLLVDKKGKQGRWPEALFVFFLPLVLFLSFRWLVFEPFVIPSESMVPNLFIHDHIIVKKYEYGIKSIWGDGWLWFRKQPQRGDVVVFRYPENREVFYIKRLIGIPGDVIEINGKSLKINNQLVSLQEVLEPNQQISQRLIEQDPAKYFIESLYSAQFDAVEHFVRFSIDSSYDSAVQKYVVPEGQYFMLGDNRNNSQDSRFWGMVPQDLVIGKAQYIWLSCDKMLESAPFICDPISLRLERIFTTIK